MGNSKIKDKVKIYSLNIFLFILSIVLIYVFKLILLKSTLLWNLVIMPYIMPVIYVTNVLQNLNNLTLLNLEHFDYLGEMESPSLFILLVAYIYVSVNIFWRNYEKGKIWILRLLLGTYVLYLFSSGYYEYSKLSLFNEINMGSSNVTFLISRMVIIFIGVYIITILYKDMDYKKIYQIFLKYIFNIFEIMLALFFAITFTKVNLTPDANIVDLYAIPIFIFGLSFFFFIIIKLLKNSILKEKL